MRELDLVSVSVTMPAELAQLARVQAAIEGKSRSQFVRELLAHALETPKIGDRVDCDHEVQHDQE